MELLPEDWSLELCKLEVVEDREADEVDVFDESTSIGWGLPPGTPPGCCWR